MAQVKFYSVNTLPETASTTGAGGVYFVTGGELYKGSSRFGANKVFTAVANAQTLSAATAGISGQIGGDILVGFGAAKVWDAEFDNGEDNPKGSWRDIGGDTAALQSMWQSDIKSWTSGLSVGDANSYITSISQASDGKVTASAAAFPTLATGDADGEIKLGTQSAKVSGWDTLAGKVSAVETKVSGIEGIVDVSTSKVTATTGSFTNLTVTSTATFSVTAVSADTLTINGSTVEQIADSRIAAIASVTASGSDSNAGITVSVTTSAGSVTGVQVSGPSIAATIAASPADNTKVAGEKAVRDAITAAVSDLAGAMHFKGTATITKSGTSITVSNFSETFTPAAGDVVVDTTNNLEAVYTGSAWELLGSNAVFALDAYAPGTEVVTAGTTTLGGAVHAIASAFDTLNSTVGAMVGGSSDDADSGIGVTVSVDASTMAPSVDVSVNAASLAAALSLGTAASMSYSTSVVNNDTTLPTGAAVTTFVGSQIAASISALDANVSSSEQAGLVVSVAQTDGVVTGVQATLVWLDASGSAITA